MASFMLQVLKRKVCPLTFQVKMVLPSRSRTNVKAFEDRAEMHVIAGFINESKNIPVLELSKFSSQ